MKRLVKYVAGILIVLLAGSAVQAKLQLVTNFEGLSGSPDGQACNGVLGGFLDTQIEGTGNSGLGSIGGSNAMNVIGHSSGGVARAVGVGGINNPIENTETGIGFFRVMVRGSSPIPRSYLGLIAGLTDDPITSANAETPTNIPVGFGLLDDGSGGLNLVKTDGTTVLKAGLARGQWYNVWIVANNETDTFDLYMSEAAGPAGDATLPAPEDLIAGNIPFGVPTTDPLNGVILANPAGTGQAERVYIDEIWWDGDQGLGPATKARNPGPADGATDVYRDALLSWMPAASAATHNVYLGTSSSEVSNAGPGSPLLIGPAHTSSTFDPGRLELGLTYFWRIDEVNAPPDSTVFKGKLWSFTTEPVGYPIDGANITATASSAAQPDFGPEKTIDGSGLDPNGLHSTLPTDMWLTDNEAQGAWIQYEFDAVYRLHQMWVWNSNQVLEAFFGFGIKDATVEYSTDGVEWTMLANVPQFTRAPGADGYAHNTTVDFDGAAVKFVKLTASTNWGGILPQFGLSEVRFLYVPVSARVPSPDSGAADVDPAVTLAWRPGREAGTHDIYVSTDQQAVLDGTAGAVGLAEPSYSSTYDLSSTYYWRVDEVNDIETPTTWQGEVWSFSTPDYLVVEDFESYNDIDPPDPASHRIFESWIDGYDVTTNGALVGNDLPPYMERVTVHGDDQSMPLFYSNTAGAVYSEVVYTFAPSQNWARHGIETLVVYFHGSPDNTGQLYANINGVKVAYDGDPAAMQLFRWQQWNIDLASLGLNLQSITTLGLGIDGNGAAGTLYIDDIRLYRSAPEVVVSSEEIWIEA
ncbi:MAG: discoidin domain-containing protein, partial [Phycisphaerales bacterium]